MISVNRCNSPSPALEIVRDGHVIFTHGYGGASPILECVELIGGNLEGSRVRTYEVDVIAARLLAYARIGSLEADRVTVEAARVLEDAGVEVSTCSIVGGEDDCGPCHDLEDFFQELRRSRRRLGLSWIT